ncbi:PREDICTED: protein FAM124B-like [Galeopterus variegatus]|uniref:Protein FAM124B-like n=1 Tax=Galeopterus variegatus TaxID=482537 RepID=A0ABM0QL63_GALVR|nr:PREDICTED: protein FAM124B-like [Galeopterus variegatus]
MENISSVPPFLVPQVQLSPGPGVRNSELSFLNGTLGADTLLQGSRLAPVSAKRTLEPRSRRSRGRRFKVHSLELPEPSGSPMSDSSSGTWWKSPGWSSQASSPAMGTQLHLPSPHLEPGARMKVLSRENSFQKFEAETNVDTGFTIINSEPQHSFLSRFSMDFQISQSPSCLPASSLGAVTCKNNRIFEERVHPLSLAGQRDLAARKIVSKCCLHLPVQGEEREEEEFFI